MRGGSVLAEGENQSAFISDARIVNPHAPEFMGIHAEIHCLRNATDEQTQGSVLYVGGVKPNNELVLSQPCEWCTQAIIDSGVRAFSWHDQDGNDYRLTFPLTQEY